MKLPKISKEVADQFKKDLKSASFDELIQLMHDANMSLPFKITKSEMIQYLTQYINRISEK